MEINRGRWSAPGATSTTVRYHYRKEMKPQRPQRSRRKGFALRLILSAVTVLAVCDGADAHPAPFSYIDLKIGRDAIEGTVIAHIFDVAHDLNVDPPERLLEGAFLAPRAGATIPLLSPRLVVSADGHVLTGAWSSVEPVPDRQSVRLRVRYPLAAPAGVVNLSTV